MTSFIGIASGLGAGNQGCREAPLFFQRNPHLLGFEHTWKAVFHPPSLEVNRYDCLNALYTRVAQTTLDLARERPFFIAIGGDHSCAIGTWSGVAEAQRTRGGIGLIWIDAHMDSHTCDTSPSGNIHGMPLAALMGHGDHRLTHIASPHPKIPPDRVSLIGIRSFEGEEEALLHRLGVRIYFMKEVRERGLSVVLSEAIQRAGPAYGVSVDLDAIDPSFVQAVGTPVPNGLDPQELLHSFSHFANNPPLAFELVEYNPSLDPTLATAHIASHILQSIVCAY